METGNLPPSHIRTRSSFDTEKNGNWEEQHTIVPKKRPLRAWAASIWAPAVHCILSVAIVVAILVYVDGHTFNLTERYSLVQVVGGTRTAPFLLKQSDIATILSAAIAAVKCALAAWAASLCWHVALFLMERRGIEFRDFQALLDFGLFVPSGHSDLSTWIIGALLLSCLIANFSSPILTGSVNWLPSNQLAPALTLDPIQIESTGIGDEWITNFQYHYQSEGRREGVAFVGVANVDIAWGPGTNPGAFKRVLGAGETLEVNSTIETALLPYFEVHSIRWIDNSEADNIPGFKDLDKFALTAPLFNSSPIRSPTRPQGCALLIPNTTTNWSSDPLDPTIIRDTRLLLLYYGYDEAYVPGETEVFVSITQNLPPNTYQMSDAGMYFAFAWVTFSAGVGRCKDHQCVITSPHTLQNSTPIELEPDPLTSQALSIAPILSLYLTGQNISVPSSWNNLDSYIEALLVRSYSGAWNTLIVKMMTTYTDTSYIPSFPGLQAQVDWKRINVWLGIQLLVTLLSVVFLLIRAKLSEYPLSGGTSLIGFYLDTTEIQSKDSMTPLEKKGILKIEPQGDRLKVKME